MKLVEFKLESDHTHVTASVNVIFEESSRPEKRVFIKTGKESSDGFLASADAFLVGCLLPALHLGEKRIFIEGEICPFLKEGVTCAMHILSD